MRALAALLLLAGPAGAVTLELPANARLQAEVTTPAASHSVATGPWTADGTPKLRATGIVTRQAWKIDVGGVTTPQLVDPLRAQLAADGFEVLLDCAGDECGGFDFRFDLEVMPAPAMFVDLLDFHYISARKAETGEAVSLLASRTAGAGFVQVTAVGPELAAAATEPRLQSASDPVLVSRGDLPTQLETVGRAILPDLVFETGSAQLGQGEFPSLQALADYLAQNPDRVVALVGHTDSIGSLDGNIALSKRRAGSVRERLVSDYAVPRRQLQAEGMGYLSPIASNLTEEGRDANRRVEVIMVSAE